jgi:peptide/nickel transport system substrate-binding protein
MKKSLLLLLVCTLGLMTLTAQGQQETKTAPPNQGAVAPMKKAVKQIYREALFPAAQGESTFITTTAHRLDSTINQPLVQLTWEGGLKPMLAESYEMQEEGKIWIMHLREGVKWHDGVAFTAKDVIWSYSAYANPKVASRWNGKAQSILGFDELRAGKDTTLKGVTALDDYTVRVELNNPMPLWLKLEQTFLVIFPEHLLGNIPPEEVIASDYWKHRIGTGPFIWTEYKPDQYIKTLRNTEYYLGVPQIEELDYVIFADVPSQLNALASGQIQAVAYEGNTISPQEAKTYDAMNNVSVVTMSKGATAFLAMNLKRTDWSDLRIRQALRYAIDIQTILNGIYPGGIKADTLFTQKWAISPKCDPYAYNPEKAKKLLQEAGWSGRKVDLVFTQKDSLSKNLLVAIQQYLKAVGVDLELRQVDAAYMTSFYNKEEFDLGFFGNGIGLDPATAQNLVGSGELLALGYSNKKIDQLFDTGKELTDQMARAPLYQEISLILNQELPKIFLWQDIRPLGFSDKVIGPKEHWEEQGTIYFNQPIYNEIEKWYVVE